MSTTYTPYPSMPISLPHSPIPMVARFSGNMDMDVLFRPGRAFRLVFIRVHFRGTYTGGSNLSLYLDSVAGEEWDTLLYKVLSCGLNMDVHLVLTADESGGLSPWTFQAGDGLRLHYPYQCHPANLSWGLEIGFEAL